MPVRSTILLHKMKTLVRDWIEHIRTTHGLPAIARKHYHSWN